MKWLYSMILLTFSDLGLGCSVVFVSYDNPNTVFMASNIASGLFFKSTCARIIKPVKEPILSETKNLMTDWNLSAIPTISTLNSDDLRQADIILVMMAEDKKKLETLYPDFSDKIDVMSECAGIGSIKANPSLSEARQHLFETENIISENGWKCLNKKD